MFLAHFSGWAHAELMEMPLNELAYWYHEAIKLYNKMNPQHE